MSTKNCPETPRQKMINMMYLVLTAMLALNVAAETLQAFKIIDASLMKTYKSFTDKNAAVVRDFERAAEENEQKVGHWRDLARDVHAKSDSLVKYIVDTKTVIALAAKAEKPEGEINDEFPLITGSDGQVLVLKSQDDLNATPEVMLTKGRGAELQNTIIEYRKQLTDMVGDFPSIVENIKSLLAVDDPEKGETTRGNTYRTWVQQNFESTPVIASIALLSKLQIDVRNAEAAVLNHLYGQIDAASFKVSGVEAKVIPNTNYVIQGQKYEAKIFLSAVDNSQEINVFMNGSNSPLPVQNGEAIYSISPNTPGFFNYKGEIRFTNPDGTPGSRLFSGEYQVAVPNVTISATKMNVLYRGLQNPVSISVPGVASDKLDVTLTNGKLIKTDNGWLVEPTELDPTGEKTKIIVNANVDGAVRQMGEMKFRVKKVPDPRPQVAGSSSGSVPREKLRLAAGVFAVLDDFLFDLNFEVTSFTLNVPVSGGETKSSVSKSYKFTNEQKALLNSLGANSKIFIEDIKAKIQGDPKDPERTLAPIIITVQ